MADHTEKGPLLGYGHFGTPFYSAKTSSWRWTRSLSENPKIVSVGDSSVTIPPVRSTSSTSKSKEISNLRQSYTLAHNNPYLVDVPQSFLSRENTISRAISQSLGDHDPLVQPLLVHGLIPDLNAHHTASVPVVAYVADHPTRKTLHFIRANGQKQSWTDSRSISISTPHLSGEHGSWTSPSPIQDVQFGGETPGYGFIVVRTLSYTFLLRVRFATWDGIQSYGRNKEGERLEVIVKAIATGNGTGAAVGINPWFAEQFATVDYKGNWRIWESKSKVGTGVTKDAEVIASGFVPVNQDDQAEDGVTENKARYDGWFKIYWIKDLETVLICDRCSIIIADVTTSTVSAPLVTEEKLWILDLQIDILHKDRFLILTPDYLIYYQVQGKAMAKDVVHFRELLRIRHYRDHLDQSLCLTLSACSNGMLVCITSQQSHTISCYLFEDQQDYQNDHISVSPPMLINMSDGRSKTPRRGIIIQNAQWIAMPIGTSGIGHQYHDNGIEFLVIHVLYDDGSITEQLFAIGQKFTFSIEAPLRKSKARPGPSRILSDRFIVNDSDVDDDDDDDNDGCLEINNPLKIRENIISNVTMRGTVNYENIYQQIINSRSNDIDSIDNVAEILKASFDTDVDNINFFIDHLPSEVRVNDLDDANDVFTTLLGNINDGNVIPIVDQALFDHGIAFRSIYDYIIQKWLSPLSDQIPGRVRLAREQLARNVAAHLCLSLYRRNPISSASTNDNVIQSSNEQQSLSQNSQTSSQPFTSQASSQQTPSTLSPIDEESTSSALTRLRRYSPTPNEIPTIPSLTTSSSTILVHWSLGSDPNQYSWLETHTRLVNQAALDEELSGMNARQRSRHEKKRKRLEEKKVKQREMYIRQQSSSQVQALPMRRDADRRFVLSSSSQIPASQPVIASQLGTEVLESSQFTIDESSQSRKKKKKIKLSASQSQKKRIEGF